MLRSIAEVLRIDIAVPDHTTLSRRGRGVTILPKWAARGEPLHLLVDSTGLKMHGEGEWHDQQHGLRSRRRWRKLHLGLDADTQEIVAAELTPDDVSDVSVLPELLDHVGGDISSMTADGADDGEAVYNAVAARHPAAAVVIPPRATAVPSQTRQRSVTDISRQSQSMDASLGNAVQATAVGARSNRDVSLQDHHWPAAARSDSAQSADRGEDCMQRSPPDDMARHASHRPSSPFNPGDDLHPANCPRSLELSSRITRESHAS